MSRGTVPLEWLDAVRQAGRDFDPGGNQGVREGWRREIVNKQAAATRLRAQNKVMEHARTDKAAAEAFVATQR